MRWRSLAVLTTAFLAAAACGDDDDGLLEPRLEREAVAGVYDISTLTFDPLGSLPVKDIATKLDPSIRPRLVVALDGTFQFAFIDPSTRRFVTVDGSYETLSDGILLSFGSTTDSQRLLLPQRLELTYTEAAGTLSFAGESDAFLARLIELVPEFEDEQLRDPVRGELRVTFTRRESDS